MDFFSATSIGQMQVKNHFIRSATNDSKASEDGHPTGELVQVYEKLAQGGVGTIITGYTRIAAYEQSAKNQMGIYDDRFIPEYRGMVEAAHAGGVKIVMQIVHGSSHSQADPEHARILGPSAVAHPVSGLVPQEMTKGEIADVVQAFADAAGRVKAAGFDGVQLHCAHGYLLSQFISPLFNRRTDEYGGSVHNRARIVMEAYQATREKVGSDYPVWIKMNCSDEAPGGLTVEEFLEMACQLAGAGMDALEVSGNQWRSHGPEERAYYQDAAMRLSELTDMPVILTGGMRSLADMERIVQNSRVSLFGLARPLIQDPGFINTLR